MEFSYRGDEVAAQAATGAIRYDISRDTARGRWYLDASWKAVPAPAPSLDELRASPVMALDVNHGHLAAAVLAADGNILGAPATLGLDLAALPSATRDGQGTRPPPEEAARPAQARPRTTPTRRVAPRKPATPPGPRQPPGAKTGRPHRTTAGNQAAQDRSGPPAKQDYLLLAQSERLIFRGAAELPEELIFGFNHL